MIHTMTVRSNPRLIWLGLILAALPVFGVGLVLTIPGLVGMLGLLAAGFITYQIAKLMLPQLRARIATDDAGITCTRPGSDDLAFRWSEVTLAGYVRQPSERPAIFLYNEEHDRLAVIPREFSDFDQLLACVQQHTPFRELRLEAGDSIQSWLRQHLKIVSDTVDEPDADDPDADNA